MIPPDTLSPLHLRGFEAICRNSWFSPGGPRCSPVHLPPPPPPADDQLGVDAGAPRLVICGQGSDVGRVTRDDATPASTHRSTVRATDGQQTDLHRYWEQHRPARYWEKGGSRTPAACTTPQSLPSTDPNPHNTEQRVPSSSPSLPPQAAQWADLGEI